MLFSTASGHCTFPPTELRGFRSSTSSPVLVIFWFYFFDSSHPGRREAVSHCDFDMHFPNDS